MPLPGNVPSLGYLFRFVFGNLFFKKRLVAVYDRATYQTVSLDHSNFRIFRVNKYNYSTYRSFILDVTARRSLFLTRSAIEENLTDPRYSTFVAVEKSELQPVGVSWALVTGDEVYWHDSFPIPPNSGFLLYSYVLPEYRRQGAYSEMLEASYEYLFNTVGLEYAYGIFEAMNLNQLKAQQYSEPKYGIKIDSVNYLIKLLGINLLSLYKNKQGTKVYFVLFR